MKQRYLVICEHEEAYALRLMRILSRSRILDAQVLMVSNPSEAERIGREKTVSILLISETFPLEERRQIRAELVFVLTGDGGEGPAEKEFAVRKYQPGKEILNNIAEIALRNAREDVFNCAGGRKTRLYGVYSPFPAAAQHAKAFQKAKKDSEKGRTLYVDARVYGGGRKKSETLADLIYALRQSEEGIGLKAGTIAEKRDNFYVLPAMPVGRDVREVEEAEWLTLIRALKSCGLYENIYIELSEGIDGLLEILPLFDEILMLTDRNMLETEKQFCDNMAKLGCREILDAVKKGEGIFEY